MLQITYNETQAASITEIGQKYLALAIAVLENIEHDEFTLVYDDAICDVSCLAEDIKNEFNVDDDNVEVKSLND